MPSKKTINGDSFPAKGKNRSDPGWVSPMLATLSHSVFSRGGWLFEPKLDGVRCLAVRFGADVRLLSRNRKRLNEKYPEVLRAFLAQRPKAFVVDGEIVTLDGETTSFSKLQRRMQLARPSEEVRRSVPVCFYAFDLLHLNGKDTRGLPLRKRKELLAKALNFRDGLRLTEHRETDGDPYFQEACKKGWEGLIAKNGESLYASGRSAEWLKFKCINEQEFVIVGYTDPQGSRTGFGALLIGFYASGELRFAGKVGTGFGAETLKDLYVKLTQIEIKTPPVAGDGLPRAGVHWVSPLLVAQIAFGEWTRDAKLRHPRFLGLRFDKDAKEVTAER